MASALSAALDRRAVVWGLVGIAVTVAITFLGSDGLVWFDAALVGYLFGVVFMVFGVIYRHPSMTVDASCSLIGGSVARCVTVVRSRIRAERCCLARPDW